MDNASPFSRTLLTTLVYLPSFVCTTKPEEILRGVATFLRAVTNTLFALRLDFGHIGYTLISPAYSRTS